MKGDNMKRKKQMIGDTAQNDYTTPTPEQIKEVERAKNFVGIVAHASPPIPDPSLVLNHGSFVKPKGVKHGKD